MDFLCWAQVGHLQGLAVCFRAGVGEESGEAGQEGRVCETPSFRRAAFWGSRTPYWFILNN